MEGLAEIQQIKDDIVMHVNWKGNEHVRRLKALLQRLKGRGYGKGPRN